MTVANHWTLVVHRGALVLAFAVMTALSPVKSLAWFAPFMLFYAMADGVLTIAAAARAASSGERWAWLFVEGLVGPSGILVIAVWPEANFPVLTWSLTAWATVTAIGAIATAAGLRNRLTRQWLLAAAAVVVCRFALLAIGATRAGEVDIAHWSWAGSVVFTVLVGLVVRWRFSSRARSALRERFAR